MKVLKFIGIPFLIIGTFFGAFVALNARATRRAERFCSSITIGEPLSTVLRRAHQNSGVVVIEASESEVLFVFQGFVFARATCFVKAENGYVKSKGFHAATD